MDDVPVLYEARDHTAIVTLNRPKTMNGIDAAVADALRDAIGQAEHDTSIRALMLRGAGKAFCAGGDISAFNDRMTYGDVAGGSMERFHPAVRALHETPLPTVACLHGAVAGAGIGLMLACDFAIAAEDTAFTLAYPRIGATIDGGASWFLSRIVGIRKAKELALLSPRFDGRIAESLGLVTRLCAPDALDAEALAFAGELASGPTAAFSALKRLINQSLDTELPVQLDDEREAFVRIVASDDFAEGLSAFKEKRSPKFEGR